MDTKTETSRFSGPKCAGGSCDIPEATAGQNFEYYGATYIGAKRKAMKAMVIG